MKVFEDADVVIRDSEGVARLGEESVALAGVLDVVN